MALRGQAAVWQWKEVLGNLCNLSKTCHMPKDPWFSQPKNTGMWDTDYCQVKDWLLFMEDEKASMKPERTWSSCFRSAGLKSSTSIYSGEVVYMGSSNERLDPDPILYAFLWNMAFRTASNGSRWGMDMCPWTRSMFCGDLNNMYVKNQLCPFIGTTGALGRYSMRVAKESQTFPKKSDSN